MTYFPYELISDLLSISLEAVRMVLVNWMQSFSRAQVQVYYYKHVSSPLYLYML